MKYWKNRKMAVSALGLVLCLGMETMQVSAGNVLHNAQIDLQAYDSATGN